MSMRRNWTLSGQHFSETSTERGGRRYFIDGKPVRRVEWILAYEAAKAKEAASSLTREEAAR